MLAVQCAHPDLTYIVGMKKLFGLDNDTSLSQGLDVIATRQ